MSWLCPLPENLYLGPGTRPSLKGAASFEGFQISPPKIPSTTTRTVQGPGIVPIILNELSSNQSGVT